MSTPPPPQPPPLPQPTPTPKYSRTHLMRHYKIYRDYMKHEDDLLNHRTTWLLIFQGFLFATLGVIGEWQVAEPSIFFTERNWLPFLLAGAGIFVAGFSWVGLKAA